MGAKKINGNDLTSVASTSLGSASVATASAWCFVKIYRKSLEHPMFRGHIDWIGAWALVLAAADQATNQINLSDVGRKANRDFGWDNDKWRRFVKRLEKEGFVATVEKKNFGDKIGHVHIASVIHPTLEHDDNRSAAGVANGATRVRKALGDGKHSDSSRGDSGRGLEAYADTVVETDTETDVEEVWIIVNEDEDIA